MYIKRNYSKKSLEKKKAYQEKISDTLKYPNTLFGKL